MGIPLFAFLRDGAAIIPAPLLACLVLWSFGAWGGGGLYPAKMEGPCWYCWLGKGNLFDDKDNSPLLGNRYCRNENNNDNNNNNNDNPQHSAVFVQARFNTVDVHGTLCVGDWGDLLSICAFDLWI